MKYILFLIPLLGFGQFNPVAFYQYGKPAYINEPVLDFYTGAKVAFSLRKIRTAYSGNCIRVRRSSDDAELDIGFTGKLMDADALLSFIGANNGYRVNLYQKGEDWIDIEKGQPLQDLIDYLTEVNKDFKPKDNV